MEDELSLGDIFLSPPSVPLPERMLLLSLKGRRIGSPEVTMAAPPRFGIGLFLAAAQRGISIHQRPDYNPYSISTML